jgi:hypothetical protein
MGQGVSGILTFAAGVAISRARAAGNGRFHPAGAMPFPSRPSSMRP